MPANKISDLSTGEQVFIRNLANQEIVWELADELNHARPVVGLALLGKLIEDEDKSAESFAQRICGMLDRARLDNAVS